MQAAGGAIQFRTLVEGGQPAADVASELVAIIAGARQRLEIALYDVRLPGPIGDEVADALREASGRGVDVRLVYNTDFSKPIPVPPPPRTRPELIEELPFPTRDIPGQPDLMHHKYVIADRERVWAGSTNWTLDSWEREENVTVTVDSPVIAAAYAHNFDELFDKRNVERSGRVRPDPADVGGVSVRPWFCPGYGEELAHRIARAIGCAKKVRIASPVLTSGPVLGTLAEAVAEKRIDLAGVVDATQLLAVFGQWEKSGSKWKIPLLRQVLAGSEFTGKRSTPWSEGSVHDFMHAKVTVCDDTVFVGSFNLSRSGERNAENVLEIEDAGLAAGLADWIDEVRARFPDVEPPRG